MVQCLNSECEEYQIPKDAAGFDPETILCGGCGGPVSVVSGDA